MGVIWTPQQRTKQPAYAVGLDRNSPLTNGLVFVQVGGDSLSLTGQSRTSNGTTSVAPTIQGNAHRFSTSNFHYSPVTVTAAPFTLASIAKVSAYASGGTMLSVANSASTDNYFQLGLNSDGTIRAVARAGGYIAANSTNAVTLNKFFCAAAIYASSTARYAWLDGVLSSVETTSASPSGVNRISIGVVGRDTPADYLAGDVALSCIWNRALSVIELKEFNKNPWQIFAPERRPLIFDLGAGGSTVTGVGSSAGVGSASGVGASTSAQVGSSAGTGTASGVGASTANSVGSSTGTGTASGVGSSTGGSDGVGTSTGTGTATGVGASTAASTGSSDGVGAGSGVGASTAASTGSASGTGTASGVGANGSVVSTGVGSASGTGTATGISPSISQGGGKTTGKNLSRKQKKKLKAVESQEWLKAEETARQLLSDRFTKQTPQEKAQALETHIESLAPVIEALKAITDQIEGVQETVQETKTEELTEHKQILNKFDALITKMTSIEELLIIMLAQ